MVGDECRVVKGNDEMVREKHPELLNYRENPGLFLVISAGCIPCTIGCN